MLDILIFVTATPAASGSSSSSTLVIFGLVAVGGWLLSLLLHPYTTCSACKGSPRQYGAIASRSFRLCGKCGGNGRQLRFGAGMFRSD